MVLVLERQTRPKAMLDEVLARRLRFVLLGIVAVFAVCAALLSSRDASFDQLTGAIAQGRVTEVTVHGGLPPGARGASTVTIEWTKDGDSRLTTVTEQSADVSPGQSSGRNTDVVIGSVRAQLKAADPTGSLGIVTAEPWMPPGPHVAGVRLPEWMGPAGLLLGVAAYLLLAFGPEPWWATRWGWVWLMLGPQAIVAVPLFLLVSGPPPRVERSTQPGWRLTGLVTFGLTVVAAGTLSTLR